MSNLYPLFGDKLQPQLVDAYTRMHEAIEKAVQDGKESGVPHGMIVSALNVIATHEAIKIIERAR